MPLGKEYRESRRQKRAVSRYSGKNGAVANLPDHTSVLRVYVVGVCARGGIREIIRLSDWQTDREGAVLMRVLTHPQGGGGAARCSNGEQRCGTARRSGSAAPRGAWPDLAAARRRQPTVHQVCGAYPAQQLLSLSCHSLQSSDKKICLPAGQALVSDAETALYVYDSETALEPETVHVVSRRRGHSVDAGEFFLSLSRPLAVLQSASKLTSVYACTGCFAGEAPFSIALGLVGQLLMLQLVNAKETTDWLVALRHASLSLSLSLQS